MTNDQKRKIIFLASNERPSEYMKHNVKNARLNEMDKLVTMEDKVKDMRLITNTNKNGILSTKLELLYIIKQKTAIVCLPESKLTSQRSGTIMCAERSGRMREMEA